ncbi:hypothetical protein EVAR_62556_1 [Eumeta japonica]|uniref:Uncharacterized protein n=1 Tax=Eumeta variegata TaxID=151549 RepID=A0A4C1YS99_EUMVA|nr:hypothetical protein EVAR_62556_1 [Eumeta japonica]
MTVSVKLLARGTKSVVCARGLGIKRRTLVLFQKSVGESEYRIKDIGNFKRMWPGHIAGRTGPQRGPPLSPKARGGVANPKDPPTCTTKALKQDDILEAAPEQAMASVLLQLLDPGQGFRFDSCIGTSLEMRPQRTTGCEHSSKCA